MCAQPAPTDTSGAPPAQRRGPAITPLQWVGLLAFIALLVWQTGLVRFDTPGGVTAYLEQTLPGLIALVLAITVHEFSHGLVATWFGDPTPRLAGRLTLNPIRHLDPIGSLMILIGAPIGWGRPMPINPAAMRQPGLGWALSSLAGPVSNVLAATVVVALLKFVGTSAESTVLVAIEAFILLNVRLAVFNLLPVPPLDGFGFLMGLAPRPIKVMLLPVLNFGPLILLAVLLLPTARTVLNGFINGGQLLVFRFIGALTGGL